MDGVIEIGPRSAAHLLNRLGYGPRPGEVRQVLERGLEAFALEQLDLRPDPELDARLSRLPTLGLSIGQVLAQAEADPRFAGRLAGELVASKIVRAVHARNQLEEVLTDFWFNHLNVFVGDGFLRFSTHAYERDAIRPHVLGRFRDLLGASARHPAMLAYLDNYLSTVPRTAGGRTTGGLNENYGRELLELHTLGVDAGYTQQDVVDAARCFTGWGIDDLRRGGNFVFRPQNHDRDAKQVFGLALPAGGGQEDGERLLDHLAAHPATARHVAFRLAQRLVADDPPPAVVARLADTFLASGGDLREVLRALLGSSDFWAEAFGPGKPKTPIEYMASALRAVGADVGSARAVADALEEVGQPPYAAAPPTGYPNRGSAWVNPSAQLARMNFALALAAGELAGVTVDPRAATAGADLDDPRAIARAVGRDVFGARLSSATADAVARLAPGGRPSVAARALGLLLASPDFQVR